MTHVLDADRVCIACGLPAERLADDPHAGCALVPGLGAAIGRTLWGFVDATLISRRRRAFFQAATIDKARGWWWVDIGPLRIVWGPPRRRGFVSRWWTGVCGLWELYLGPLNLRWGVHW